MRWRFTILNNRTSETTVIDEPVGWDKNKMKITRDPDWHGIFFYGQGDSANGPVLEFYGNAEEVLKAEYDTYAAQGDMDLIIEEDCGDGFELFKQPKFDFADYLHTSGSNCFVSITLDQNSDVLNIRNLVDQKVNLETELAFDETTALAPYNRLPFDLLLPSKGILLQNKFNSLVDFSTPVAGVPFNDNPGGIANGEFGMIEFGFDNQQVAEIGSSGTQLQALYNCVVTLQGYLGCATYGRFELPASVLPAFHLLNEVAPFMITPICNYQEGTPNYGQVSDVVDMNIQLKGSITSINVKFAAIYVLLITLPKGRNQEDPLAYIYHDVHVAFSGSDATTGVTHDIDYNYANPNFELNKGDRVYAFVSLYHNRLNSDSTDPGFTMQWDADNFFNMVTLTHQPATVSKMFAINETISRVAEAITNDKVRGYSEYFGRTDSEPYSHEEDGCGALAAITDGLRVRRQENKIPTQPTPFSVSLKDIFEGLNPLHNIGMGLEADPFRTGYNRLRVEPWHFFYNNTVVLYCRNIKTIKRKFNPKKVYSIFKFGYQKWEAEEYNGLDEFHSKREYRTTLKEINNTLTKYSTFIAGGSTLEITRRIGNNNSRDWRYDKDTFIVCLSRAAQPFQTTASFTSVSDSCTVIMDSVLFFVGHTYSITGTANNDGGQTVTAVTPIGGDAYIIFFSGSITTEVGVLATFQDVTAGLLSVELGNVGSPVNIIDPPTIYNYRISPVRNAMRWMNKVLQSYRAFDANAKIVFTDGDGNYFAEGEMESALCKLENAPIAENVTINANIYADTDDAQPFLLPEDVMYEYPMDSCDYKDLEANPGGLIYFENECEKGYGHISDIDYRPFEQMATFNLIPAITNLPIPNTD